MQPVRTDSEAEGGPRLRALSAHLALDTLRRLFQDQSSCDRVVGSLVEAASALGSESPFLGRVAGALATVPEFLNAWRDENEDATLDAGSYVRRALTSLVRLGWAGEDTPGNTAHAPDPALAQQLAGEFLERLASRGGTRLAGEALAEAAALINTQATALLVLPWVKDPRARHRVFAAALSSELGSKATGLLSSIQHTPTSPLSCIDWPRLLLDPAAPLPPAALEAVVEHLAASTALLPELSLRLAQAWSASGTEPGRRQSFLTLALIKCLRRLDPAEADADPMLPTLLRGVSAHLESPPREVRLRGMRVGRAFSEVLALPKKEAGDSEGNLGANEEAAPEILFTEDLPDEGWEDADEPYWQRAQSVRLVRDAAWSVKRQAAGDPVASGAVDENGTEADLGPAEDDEDANEGGSSRQAFEAYDLDESDEEGTWQWRIYLRTGVVDAAIHPTSTHHLVYSPWQQRQRCESCPCEKSSRA